MKQIVLFFTLIFTLSRAAENIQSDLISIVEQGFKITEMNPLHKSDDDSLELLFTCALHSRGDREELRSELFRALYRNSSSVYEDSQDVRRLKSRRARLFAAIALTGSEDNYETFLDYAKFSLMSGEEVEEFLEMHYCAILFLEQLIQLREDPRGRVNYDAVESYLIEEKESLPGEFYTAAAAVIRKR